MSPTESDRDIPASSTVSATARTTSAAPGIKVVGKVFRLLDAFTVETPSWTATELARNVDMPVATVHRILRSLEDQAYVVRNENTRYRLGLAAIDLGRRATASLQLPIVLQPTMQGLLRQVHETVILSVYDERRHAALTVARAESTRNLRLSLDVGTVTPLNAGATGKAMLAFLDPPIAEAIITGPLEQLTPRSIASRAKLRREVAEIRDRGWAYSREETNLGAWGVAAPILSREGSLIAVLGIAAPTARYTEPVAKTFARRTMASAREAEQILDKRSPG